MEEYIFFFIEEVLKMHEVQIEEFGGSYGLRDRGLLESALSMPMASFGGAYLHEDIFSMAAAYMYHLIKNHPFVDGNKRTGVVVALAFLKMNGFPAIFSQEEVFALAIEVATSLISKEELAARLRKNSRQS
jgi:death on curing protein